MIYLQWFHQAPAQWLHQGWAPEIKSVIVSSQRIQWSWTQHELSYFNPGVWGDPVHDWPLNSLPSAAFYQLPIASTLQDNVMTSYGLSPHWALRLQPLTSRCRLRHAAPSFANTPTPFANSTHASLSCIITSTSSINVFVQAVHRLDTTNTTTQANGNKEDMRLVHYKPCMGWRRPWGTWWIL